MSVRQNLNPSNGAQNIVWVNDSQAFFRGLKIVYSRKVVHIISSEILICLNLQTAKSAQNWLAGWESSDLNQKRCQEDCFRKLECSERLKELCQRYCILRMLPKIFQVHFQKLNLLLTLFLVCKYTYSCMVFFYCYGSTCT